MHEQDHRKEGTRPEQVILGEEPEVLMQLLERYHDYATYATGRNTLSYSQLQLAQQFLSSHPCKTLLSKTPISAHPAILHPDLQSRQPIQPSRGTGKTSGCNLDGRATATERSFEPN